jgi:hypothetical protein
VAPNLLCGVAASLLLGACTGAFAQAPVTSSNFTLYGAYRMGGSLRNTTTDANVDIEEHSSIAAALDLALDPGRQTEFFYSRQKTVLFSRGLAGSSDKVPISIEYFHVGGTSFLGQSIAGTYVMGGIGVTHASPDFSGLHPVTRLSMNLGLGYLLPLRAGLGMRFEARGYATLLESEGGLFCGGDSGCVISVKGDALYQTEILLGVSGRF